MRELRENNVPFLVENDSPGFDEIAAGKTDAAVFEIRGSEDSEKREEIRGSSRQHRGGVRGGVLLLSV